MARIPLVCVALLLASVFAMQLTSQQTNVLYNTTPLYLYWLADQSSLRRGCKPFIGALEAIAPALPKKKSASARRDP